MDFTVYVLKSIKTGKRYIGYTNKDVKERVNEHNTRHTTSTKGLIPYELVYFEKGYCKDCALTREKFLKSGQGRRILDLIIGA